MDLNQMLATGGISGVVVVLCIGVYWLCKNRRTRCQSNCATDDGVSPTRVAPEAIKPQVSVT